MTSSVLVTGGAGFVGSGLVRRLLDIGHTVVVIDNMVRGSTENLPDHANLTVIEGDIRSGDDLAKAMACKPKYVAHLAAHHFIPYCDKHPGETVSVNVYGTEMVLEAIQRSQSVEKLVFASTAAVYGPSDTPHKENEPMAPIDIYGVSKKLGEELVEFFHRQTGIPSVNARLFNVIGPRETNPHLLPDIFEQLPNGSNIKLGNLLPQRDYIYTDDIAEGIITMLQADVSYESINVGTGSAYSAQEVVDQIAEVLGSNITIDSVADRQRAGDRPFLCADNSRLRQLGWNCADDLHSSLKKTLDFYALS
jgi:UDP-glucose 4-epimerase